MNIIPSEHFVKLNLSRPEAAPALRAVLSRSYQRWIRSFLDNEGEAKRATISFMAALRNQPSQPPEMDTVA